MLLLLFADLFSKLSFQRILSGTLSECKIVSFQIRTDILLVLIWVHTFCKCYQHATKVPASKERVKVMGTPQCKTEKVSELAHSICM